VVESVWSVISDVLLVLVQPLTVFHALLVKSYTMEDVGPLVPRLVLLKME